MNIIWNITGLLNRRNIAKFHEGSNTSKPGNAGSRVGVGAHLFPMIFAKNVKIVHYKIFIQLL